MRERVLEKQFREGFFVSKRRIIHWVVNNKLKKKKTEKKKKKAFFKILSYLDREGRETGSKKRRRSLINRCIKM